MAVATWHVVEDRALTKTLEAQRAKAKAKAAATGVPWARCGNFMLGIWLQVSAFTWPHSDASRVSAWLPGLLISVISLLSMGSPPMRWLNAFLALWLVVWTFAATTTEPLSYWNGVVCGLLVFVLAAIPSKSAASDYRD
jgi:hypothetical protein